MAFTKEFGIYPPSDSLDSVEKQIDRMRLHMNVQHRQDEVQLARRVLALVIANGVTETASIPENYFKNDPLLREYLFARGYVTRGRKEGLGPKWKRKWVFSLHRKETAGELKSGAEWLSGLGLAPDARNLLLDSGYDTMERLATLRSAGDIESLGPMSPRDVELLLNEIRNLVPIEPDMPVGGMD